MNRSILIVICDFLLVSLLAFSNFEPVNDAEHKTLPPPPQETRGQQDMVRALKLALDDERQGRTTLAAELANARAAAQTQQSLSTQRENQMQQVQETLRQTESQTRRLDQQRTALQQQMATAQTNLQTLGNSLTASRSETKLSQQELEALRIRVQQEQEAALALRQRLAALEQSHSNAVAEKQQLNTKLQVTEVEKRLTSEQLASMRSEVQSIRAEKAQLQANTAKLAEGVSTLAEKSAELAQEIRESRPLAANAVFNEFTQNRIDAQFELWSGGPLGTSVRKDKSARTLLVTDGKETWALFHITDTPFALGATEARWQSLRGTLSRGNAAAPMARVSFLARDPRIVAVPVDAAQAQKLGAKVFKVAAEPFKFQDAVLVGANEGYYGECKFQIDLSTPQYVKMDRSLFRALFGKFNPSRGDLVMSRTGELLGIMVNDQYCVVLGEIIPSATIQVSDDLKSQQTGPLFAELHKRWLELPGKLQ